MHEGLHKLLDKDKVEALLLISRTRFIKAGELFVNHGEVPAKIAFVSSGLFRYVYVNDKGDEFTKGIIGEHTFIASYSAMIARRPSYFAIEALEDAEVLEIPWADFSQLLEADVFWLRFLLKFVEKGFISKEKRERDLLLLDAETRYKNFLNEFPGIDQRITQGIIASYLGIKPETLSRIRRKIIF